ncbi:hypothetical protein D3C79_916160 [compost metagenome]
MFTQTGKRSAHQLLQLRAELGRQGNLHHRNIRFGVHQRQWHPGAVVKGPLWVEAGRHTGGAEQFTHVLSQGGITWSRVLHGIQRSGEAAEVMPGVWLRAAGYQQFTAFPVR